MVTIYWWQFIIAVILVDIILDIVLLSIFCPGIIRLAFARRHSARPEEEEHDDLNEDDY